MRFSIEHLKETTDEYSVCSSREVDVASLDCARAEAWRELSHAQFCGATGFQIRDGRRCVVAIEEYNDLPGSRTIH